MSFSYRLSLNKLTLCRGRRGGASLASLVVPRACAIHNARPCASPARPHTALHSRMALALFAGISAAVTSSSAEPSVEDVREARVAVMSIPACPYCKRAKEALTAARVNYVDIDVGFDQELRQVVRDLTGKRTVPQIFVAGRSIGGCDDLQAQLADGSFQKLLAPDPAASGRGTGRAQAAGGQVAAAASGGDGGAEASGAERGRAGVGAVPPELVAAIEAARRRRAAAQAQAASTAAGSTGPSSVPSQRLRELAARMALPPAQGGIERVGRKIGSRTFTVFTPDQLRTWLAASSASSPQEEVDDLVRQLLAANLVVPAAAKDTLEAERVAAAAAAASTAAAMATGAGAGAAGEEVLLTLAWEAPSVAPGEALNTQYWWQGPARPASEVAASLRQLILELYDSHLSPDGRSVSYGAMRADPRFGAFVAATAELQKVDLTPLSTPELTALALNLYNALIIHALVALGLTRMSAAQRATFFSRTAKYNIGGLDYTADDLENGVLRGNRAGAASVWNLLGLPGLAGGHFRSGDPRLDKIVTPVDPRIHFALVCGAASCPPIRTYSADTLEEGLAGAAEAFCGDGLGGQGGNVEVDVGRREVRLSKIFKWYAVDFGSNKLERLSYISSLLPQPARGQLQALVEDARAGRGDVRVSYNEYDWSLNGTD